MNPRDKVLSLGKLAVSNVEKDYMEIHAMPNAPRPGHDSMVVMIFKGLNPELKPLDPLQSLPEVTFHRGKMGTWQGFAGAINVCMKAWEVFRQQRKVIGAATGGGRMSKSCVRRMSTLHHLPAFWSCKIVVWNVIPQLWAMPLRLNGGKTGGLGFKGLPHFGFFQDFGKGWRSSGHKMKRWKDMREPHGGALRCSGFSELNDSFFSPPKRCILRCRDLLFKVISIFS